MKSRAAIYCRLSKEDIEKKESDYSESIKNQESMLIEYAKQHNFRIAKIYRDIVVQLSRQKSKLFIMN